MALDRMLSLRTRWRSPLGRLRVLGAGEGASFLMLLFIAMPLKYLLGQPLAVRIVGSIHGMLFLWLAYETLHVTFAHGWRKKHGAKVILAALLPFGPFLIDGWLAREDSVLNSTAEHQRT